MHEPLPINAMRLSRLDRPLTDQQFWTLVDEKSLYTSCCGFVVLAQYCPICKREMPDMFGKSYAQLTTITDIHPVNT